MKTPIEILSKAACSMTCRIRSICGDCKAHEVFSFSAEMAISALKEEGYEIVKREDTEGGVS